MKLTSIILLACVLISVLACNHETEKDISINNETTIEDEVMLYGPVDRTGFQLAEYAEWFKENYDSYEPNDSILDLLKGQLDEIEIKIFMGSWCEDSQRDIPAFYRIVDQLNFSPQHSIVAVDRSKERPEMLLKSYDIEYVPTFILYRNKAELGRIVEIPELSLEEDILKIISVTR